MTVSIVLITGNHLCHNPRAIKEASALAKAGREVLVLGAWTDASLKARDKALVVGMPFAFVPVVDATDGALRARMLRLLRRIRGRAASMAHRLLGIESRAQFGQAVGGLLRAAERTPATLYIAHSEAGLHVASALAAGGATVAVDMEDWYSEDLLPEARSARPTRRLRRLERELLQRAAYSSCPSESMSRALALEYACPAPTVIYNAFSWQERELLDGRAEDRRGRTVPSIHWYSQTLGPGRGLEDLVTGLRDVRAAAELHLRGALAAGFEAWLWDRAPDAWRERIFIQPLVPNDQLLSRIAEHDVGFAGERSDIRSRDLTVTNKVLHYLLGGLAVVASDTAGQREVAGLAPNAVRLYPGGNAAALAAELNRLLDSPAQLAAGKAAALRAAAATFCWEKQEGRLVEAADRALAAAKG